MVREKLRRFFRKKHSDSDDLKNLQFGPGNQFVDDSSIHHAASTTKPDLWQRAFDEIEPKEQQLIQSILLTQPHKDINSSDSDVNTDPGVMDRLKALTGVIEAVKTQYEIDQRKSKIKEPTQKIIKAALSFKDLIQAAVAFDPTGHATSVWAIVSLGLTVCLYFSIPNIQG